MSAPPGGGALNLDSARGAEVSLYDVVNIALRRRRLLVRLPLVLFAVTVVVTVLLPRSYTASAWFSPASQSGSTSRLLGIARQFGIALPNEDQGPTPAFYADLLRSDEFLGRIVEARYRLGTGDTALTLTDIYRLPRSDSALRHQRGVARLRRDLSTAADPQTGLVKVTVRSRYAVIAEQVARRALAAVNEFNLQARQLRASLERQFIEERAEQLRRELLGAEGRLQAFLQRNRRYQDSPELVFEYERLSREVSMRQELYTNLSQAYEQARIDEVRNTPAVVIVQEPQVPARPVPRGLVVKGLLSLVVGALLALGIALAQDAFARSRFTDPRGAEELAALRREALADAQRLVTRFLPSRRDGG